MLRATPTGTGSWTAAIFSRGNKSWAQALALPFSWFLSQGPWHWSEFSARSA
jgi:hypothetical protein